jgi:hypothetical protein
MRKQSWRLQPAVVGGVAWGGIEAIEAPVATAAANREPRWPIRPKAGMQCARE